MPTAAQVVETSVTVNSSPIQDYTHMTIMLEVYVTWHLGWNRRLPL